jgi:tetratricopeptide (TPR) repeat protein
MAGKRAVVVLDNANDVSQVRALIPGTPGILVVVTSRRRLMALEGALPLSLDVLPMPDAISLFEQIVGDERVAGEQAAVTTAVELCGRLPLAIRIAAARLRDRRSWRVANLVERLESQRRNDFLQTGDRSVTAALRLSLRYLSPAQQTLFRLLSLHPGHDFDAHAAAALAGIAAAEAEDELEVLLDDNLLRQDVVGRYHFHDLVRDCARQLCVEVEGQDGTRAAQRRLLDYYLHATREWSRHLLSSRQEVEDTAVRYPYDDAVTSPATGENATAILRAEYANLVAVAHFAADEGWPRHAWLLIRAMQPYLRYSNQIGASRALFEMGLRAAQADGDAHGRSVLTQAIAVSCREHGDKAAAESYMTQALELSRSIGDVRVEASQLTDLAVIHYDTRRILAAYQGFVEAERVSSGAANPGLGLVIANNLAVVCRDLGRWEEGLAHVQRALDLGEKQGGSVESRCLLWWNAGMIEHRRARNHEAARLFEQVMSVSVEAGYEMGEMDALLGLCSTDRALGKVHSAVERGRQALVLARRHDSRKAECEVLNVLGEATFAAGDVDKAAEIFTQARGYATQYGLQRYLARSLEGLAHVAWASCRFAPARDLWEQAHRTHPADLVEREIPLEHLAATEGDNADCFRCRFEYDAGSR